MVASVPLDTAADEVSALQGKLAEKLAECEKLRRDIAEARAAKDAAFNCGKEGISAARKQMSQLRADLTKARQWQRDHAVPSQQSFEEPYGSLTSSSADAGGDAQHGSIETEDDRNRRRILQKRARGLRHELARWQHEVELLELEQPGQEAAIGELKGECMHLQDVLESTRHVVRHIELERDLQHMSAVTQQAPPPDEPGDEHEHHQVLAMYGNIEANAERRVRERAEDRSASLLAKAKKLNNVASAQQLLIQRLEKQLIKEEKTLEQREIDLFQEKRSMTQLKGAMRKRSDEFVAASLGFPTASRRAASQPPGRLPIADEESKLLQLQSDVKLPAVEN